MLPINNPLQWHYEFPKQHPFMSFQFMGAPLQDHDPRSRLDKTDNDKVHWKSIRLFLKSLNSSSHLDFQLLDENNMNNFAYWNTRHNGDIFTLDSKNLHYKKQTHNQYLPNYTEHHLSSS
jgi:hypothetical protein